MHLEDFRDYCLAKRGVSEGFPFDGDTLVFKVGGKMFALTNIDAFESVNLKCDPVRAMELREMYPEVQPGYHMSKKHWNTIKLTGAISDALLCQWIDHSYDLVVQGLSKAIREKL